LWVDLGEYGVCRLEGLCNEVSILGRQSVTVIKLEDCDDADVLRSFTKNDGAINFTSERIISARVLQSPVMLDGDPKYAVHEDPSLVTHPLLDDSTSGDLQVPH